MTQALKDLFTDLRRKYPQHSFLFNENNKLFIDGTATSISFSISPDSSIENADNILIENADNILAEHLLQAIEKYIENIYKDEDVARLTDEWQGFELIAPTTKSVVRVDENQRTKCFGISVVTPEGKVQILYLRKDTFQIVFGLMGRMLMEKDKEVWSEEA